MISPRIFSSIQFWQFSKGIGGRFWENVLMAEAPRSKGNGDIFDFLRAICLVVCRG